jgi:O-antigen/teichoic acid export membrane protein
MNSLPDSATAIDPHPVAVPRKPPSISTHYLRYSASNALALVAGFISFPILTRLLDNTQFGILRYYESFMLFGVAIIKLGAPHAIVRLYPYEGGAKEIRAFGTNSVMLPLMLSAMLWILGAIGLAAWSLQRAEGFNPIFWCAVLLTPMLAASAIVQSVMRASERSDIVMASRMLGRLLELALVLAAVILVQQSALAVYGGKIAAAVLLLAWLIYWLRRNIRFAREAIDLGTLRAGLVYGLPLMAHELTYAVLSNVDRVLIKQITGDFAMAGIYTIGWSLAMQVNLFISATLSEAFIPVANRVYESGGSGAVRALKKRILVPMTYAVVAIVAMVLVTGKDLIVALSGASKAASGEVFVVLGVTVALQALVGISSFGMLLKKRTMLVLMITIGTTLLNVAMNFILIPRLGYMGAAWAAAISYGAMALAQFIGCPKGLVQLPGARTLALALFWGIVLVGVAEGTGLFGLQGAWPRLAVAGLLLAVLYVLPVLALDPELRRGLATLRARE